MKGDVEKGIITKSEALSALNKLKGTVKEVNRRRAMKKLEVLK
ncbi:MAG: hypothetical protein ACE5PM_05915 [Candidatus Hydrothermarchaeales archaeon]